MGKDSSWLEDLYKKLYIFTEKALRWGLSHRKIVLRAATVWFIASFSLVGMRFIGPEFMPNGDRG